MQNVEFGQTKVMQICNRETLNHQGAITHEVCCLAVQCPFFALHYLSDMNLFTVMHIALKKLKSKQTEKNREAVEC